LKHTQEQKKKNPEFFEVVCQVGLLGLFLNTLQLVSTGVQEHSAQHQSA